MLWHSLCSWVVFTESSFISFPSCSWKPSFLCLLWEWTIARVMEISIRQMHININNLALSLLCCLTIVSNGTCDPLCFYWLRERLIPWQRDRQFSVPCGARPVCALGSFAVIVVLIFFLSSVAVEWDRDGGHPCSQLQKEPSNCIVNRKIKPVTVSAKGFQKNQVILGSMALFWWL